MSATVKFLSGVVVADSTLGARQIRVVANSGKADRVKDTLKAAGCVLDNYRLNPIVLADHNPAAPIGNFAPEITDQVEGVLTFAPQGVSAKADEYCGLYKSGVMNTVSVGFKPIEYEPNEAGGYDFLKWELLELSCVAVPCDPGAVVTQRALTKEAPVWKVGASRNLPLGEDSPWDGPAAEKSIFDHCDFDGDHPDVAFARKGFLVYDSAAPTLKGSYKLPFAHIVDGRLTASPAGLRAAASRLPPVDISDEARAKARAVIDCYEAKMQEDDGKAYDWAKIKTAFGAKADPDTVALVKDLVEAAKAGRVLSADKLEHVKGLMKCLSGMSECQAKALDSHGVTHDQLVSFVGHLNTAESHAKGLLKPKPKPKPTPADPDADNDADQDPDDDPDADVELSLDADRRKRMIEIAERAPL